MKKIVTMVLTLCLSLVAVVPLAGAEDVTNSTADEIPAFVNERVLNLLEDKNIDFKVEDGKISITDLSSESISEVNQLLTAENQAESISTLATTYPTVWTHMRNYDFYGSAKFTAATKVALGAAFAEWAKNKFVPDYYKISVVAAAGFGLYYFYNTDREDLYTYIMYSYRELGPGFFDQNGTFIGDYEILKEITVTKNSNYTGGSYGTDARLSSIVQPWF